MVISKRILFKAWADLKKDPVLIVAFIAALVSSFYVPPSRAYLDYVDLPVICLLLSLMLVVAGLQSAGVFRLIIDRLLGMVHNTRALAAVLVGISFFASMFITNDVALITFVPLAVLVLTQAEKPALLIPVIVLQTLAANLGSMLTPLGNPQNLYLYALTGMPLGHFLKVMAFPSALALLMLAAAVMLIKPSAVKPAGECGGEGLSKKKAILWLILFVLCLLAVLHLVPYLPVLAVVIIGALILDRRVLFSADYGLLLTFIFLFVFIGNIKSIPALSGALSSLVRGRELPVAVVLSQVISNVPAAMLLSKFSTNFDALLIGVNLGGMGTLIASMASLISYKQYAAAAGARKGRYLLVFTAANVLFLLVIWGAVALVGTFR